MPRKAKGSSKGGEVEGFEGLDRGLVKKACTALVKHLATPSDGPKNLLGDAEGGKTHETVYLQIVLGKLQKRTRHKPLLIKIPHGLYSEGRVCLLTKDPVGAVEDLVEGGGGSGLVHRVLGFGKLKESYGTFARRRELLGDFECFLVDDRILPNVPRLLGATFTRARQTPLPVRIARNGKLVGQDAFSREISRVKGCAAVRYLGQGSSVAVRIGTGSFSPTQLAENAIALLPRLAAQLQGGASAIQRVFLKSSSSVAIPLYTSLAFASLPADEDEEHQQDGEAEGEGDGVEVEEEEGGGGEGGGEEEGGTKSTPGAALEVGRKRGRKSGAAKGGGGKKRRK